MISPKANNTAHIRNLTFPLFFVTKIISWN